MKETNSFSSRIFIQMNSTICPLQGGKIRKRLKISVVSQDFVETVGYIREIYEHSFGDMSRQLTSVSLTTPLERYYDTILP
jgi:hypothetical protein